MTKEQLELFKTFEKEINDNFKLPKEEWQSYQIFDFLDRPGTNIVDGEFIAKLHEVCMIHNDIYAKEFGLISEYEEGL